MDNNNLVVIIFVGGAGLSGDYTGTLGRVRCLTRAAVAV